MKDQQTRDNFIRTLEETRDIARASGEFFSSSVLNTLLGALASGKDRDLATITGRFSESEAARLRAEIASESENFIARDGRVTHKPEPPSLGRINGFEL